jgi:hypothetical protein
MPVIQGGRIIEGAVGVYHFAGTPSAGTNEVQTLTVGGTPSGGTFKLAYDGQTTAAITWSATNTTLVANIDAALEALSTIGTGGITTAVGTMTAGVGTITLTAAGNLARKAISTITVADNSLTGTSPTVAVVETTPGVDATFRGIPLGAVVTDSTTGAIYSVGGSPTAPTFTAQA